MDSSHLDIKSDFTGFDSGITTESSVRNSARNYKLKKFHFHKEYKSAIKSTEWKDRYYSLDTSQNALIEDKQYFNQEKQKYEFTEQNVVYQLRDINGIEPPRKNETGDGRWILLIVFSHLKQQEIRLKGSKTDIDTFYQHMLKCLQ